MSKPRKPKSEKRPLQRAKNRPPLAQPQSRFWFWFGAIGTFLGILAGVVVFFPRLTVAPEGTLDPSDPYPISFTITNINIIPLHKMDISMGLCYFATSDPESKFKEKVYSCKSPYDLRISPPHWLNHTLAMEDRLTITLDDAMKVSAPAKFAAADIAIIVSYEPWFIPIRREKGFKFKTKLQSNGQLQWMSLPYAE